MATEPSRPEGEHRDRTPDGARNVGFWRFLYRVTTCQLVTYFVAGMFAYVLLDYRTLFQSGHLAVFMRGFWGHTPISACSRPICRSKAFRLPARAA